jgi:hypothetical protein
LKTVASVKLVGNALRTEPYDKQVQAFSSAAAIVGSLLPAFKKDPIAAESRVDSASIGGEM